MTPETALWVIGAALVPLLSAGFTVWTMVREIRTGVKRLVHQHDNADQFGFGTTQTNAIISENTVATKALTHYIKWLGDHSTAVGPPPPLD